MTLIEVCHSLGFEESLDLGLGPFRSRRGHLGRAAATVLAVFGDRLPRVA
jgi:hypothetical protein